jgi:cell division protein FtsL
MNISTFLFSQSIVIYSSAFILIVIAAIIFKVYFSISIKNKLKEYQSEIAKSHSKILKLEVTNQQLNQRVHELENIIQRPKIA